MKRIVTAVIVLIGCGTGVAGAAGFATYADYSGAELFLRFCAACHGESAQGDGPVAPTLTVLVPDLTRLSQRRGGRFPASEVREIIDGRGLIAAHGPRYMPIWGFEFWVEEGADVQAEAASREIIDKLVKYLASIQEEPPDPTLPR
jgi:mono/diheme cytochrome c family protein